MRLLCGTFAWLLVSVAAFAQYEDLAVNCEVEVSMPSGESLKVNLHKDMGIYLKNGYVATVNSEKQINLQATPDRDPTFVDTWEEDKAGVAGRWKFVTTLYAQKFRLTADEPIDMVSLDGCTRHPVSYKDVYALCYQTYTDR